MGNNHRINYADALKTVLDNFPSKCVYSAEDIDTYILAFSFYLSAGDDAYRYHTAFLAQKHSNFREFLRQAKEKQTRLGEFIAKLKQCKKIEQWRSGCPTQASEIRISIDDFCQGSLSEDIFLCDEASIGGAEWGKNIITIHFRERTASFLYPASVKDMERAAEIFLSLVADRREREGGQ